MSNQPVTTTTPSPLLIETTDLLYLLDLVKNEVKTEMNCHAVGTIQTFDPTTMTCTVNINYQKIFRKRNSTSPAPNTYTDVVVPYPTLLRVPIVVMGGGGSYITFPITGITYNSDGTVNYPGDTCLVLFCDRDIDGWLESGQITNPPFTGRLHDLSDAIALVGLYPTTEPISNYLTNAISTSYGSSKITIFKTSISISCGSSTIQILNNGNITITGPGGTYLEITSTGVGINKTPTEPLDVNGTIQGTNFLGKILGAPSSLSANVIYQAATDVWVTALCNQTTNGNGSFIQILSDSNSSPVAVVDYVGNGNSNVNGMYYSVKALVNKGNYWTVTSNLMTVYSITSKPLGG